MMLGLKLRMTIKTIDNVYRIIIWSVQNSFSTKFEVMRVKSNYIGRGYK